MREAELIAVKLVKESDRRWALLSFGCRGCCFPHSQAQDAENYPSSDSSEGLSLLVPCLFHLGAVVVLQVRFTEDQMQSCRDVWQERSRMQNLPLFSVIK